MRLHKAFGIVPGDVVAFVGAGGKSSAMISLGYELTELGLRVLATTTTRIGVDQMDLMPYALPLDEGAAQISYALSESRFVFLYDHIRGNKAHGLATSSVPRLLDTVDSDVILIEADGARGMPLKAPKAHEPVIPDESSLVVPFASLAVLGQPLDDSHVYNSVAIDDKYGFGLGNRVKSPWVAQVMRDEEFGLKGVPSGARVIGFLNLTPPQGYMRARARMIAQLMLRSPRYNGVALGTVRSADPVLEVQRHVSAIVLAAGKSSRMGQPKVLLPWTSSHSIIEHIIDQLLLARLQQVVVVTGYRSGEVRRLVVGAGAEVAYNPRFASGEMLSSLKTGLRAMPAHVMAALVVLGDQPRIQPRVVAQIMAAYAEGAGEIIAPSYQMRRGHPILIDRRYWQEILDLPEDGVPRDVIDRHHDRIHHVAVDTDSVLRDVDTPQDYRQERRLAGLDR